MYSISLEQVFVIEWFLLFLLFFAQVLWREGTISPLFPVPSPFTGNLPFFLNLQVYQLSKYTQKTINLGHTKNYRLWFSKWNFYFNPNMYHYFKEISKIRIIIFGLFTTTDTLYMLSMPIIIPIILISQPLAHFLG